MTPERILVVDSNDAARERLAGWLRGSCLFVATADGPATAAQRLSQECWDLVVVDAECADAALPQLRDAANDANLPLLVFGIEDAVPGSERGDPARCQLVRRPVDPAQALLHVRGALALRAARLALARAQTAIDLSSTGLGALPGDGLAEVRRAISVVAPTEATVLITGEPGSGRTLVARAIHGLSERRHAPFVTIACAAMSDSAFTEELFGTTKDEAAPGRRGLVELADGGTLLLAGIAHSSPHVQREVARVLEERRIVRAGSHQLVPVNFRCLATSTPDLQSLIGQQRFNPDLFYLLDVIEIAVPPLRKRPGDLPLLAQHFADRSAAAVGRAAFRLTAAAVQRLQRHSWPGNVRELANTIERAVMAVEGTVIDAPDLILPVRRARTDVDSRVAAGA